jgi:hypothetical protein
MFARLAGILPSAADRRSCGPRPHTPERLTSSFVPHPSMPSQSGTTMPKLSGAQQLAVVPE